MDEVGLALGRDLVEQRGDGRCDDLVAPALQGGGPEGGGNQVAIGAVLVAVHGEDRPPHVRAHGVVVDARREGLAVPEHCLHVVPPVHDVEVEVFASVADGVLHRLAAPALGPHRVGIVDVVERRVELGQLLSVNLHGAQPRRSITVALAWPPPSHMVWKP